MLDGLRLCRSEIGGVRVLPTGGDRMTLPRKSGGLTHSSGYKASTSPVSIPAFSAPSSAGGPMLVQASMAGADAPSASATPLHGDAL